MKITYDGNMGERQFEITVDEALDLFGYDSMSNFSELYVNNNELFERERAVELDEKLKEIETFTISFDSNEMTFSLEAIIGCDVFVFVLWENIEKYLSDRNIERLVFA
jgi:hypothetical protein